MAKFKLVLNIVLLSILLSSCGSVKTPDCVSRYMVNFALRWGQIDNTSNTMIGFRLDSKGTIYEFSMDMKTKLINEQQLSQLNGEVFCAAFDKTTRIVLQISSLNVPANINHFVEYEIPDNNFYKRAIWDPKYENKGNREYRALMVDLLDLIEKNEYKEKIISSIRK